MKIMTKLINAAVLTAISSNLSAAPIGTPAGDVISNTASIAYTVGGTSQTPIESSELGNSTVGVGNGSATTFVVDEKVDLTVTPGSAVIVTAPGTTQAITFTLTNEGNGTRDFSFATLAAVTGDDFDPTTCDIPATETAVVSGDQRTITVNCAIPSTGVGGVINGAAANVDLKATAVGAAADALADAGTDDPDVEETVLADGTGTATDGANRNADHSAINTYTVSSASITVQKTEAVTAMGFDLDDLSGTGTNGNETSVTSGEALYHIPGATIQYQIIVSNGSSAATATGITITDTVPSTLTVVGTPVLSGDGTVTDTTASVAGDNNVVSDEFSLAADETATLTITATVN